MNHIIFRQRAEALRDLGYTVQGKQGGGNSLLLEITRDRPFYHYRTSFEQTAEQIVAHCRNHHLMGVTHLLCPHPGEEGDLGFGFLEPEQFRELETLCDMQSKNQSVIELIEENQRDIQSRMGNFLASFEDYQILGGYKK
jgi:hypothetical protein